MKSQTKTQIKEVAVSILCGLLLISLVYPEVIFLDANLRKTDIVYSSVIDGESSLKPLNIIPKGPGRNFWDADHDSGGATLQSDPGMEFMRESLQNSESFYWNPYSAVGALGPETLVDNKFAVVNWIYALLGGGQRVFDLIFLISVWLAVSCMHRFLRSVMDFPQVSAYTGAFFFCLNGFCVANLGSNVAWSYYFIPPCLLTFCRLIERLTPRRLAAASIALASLLSFTFMPTTVTSLCVVIIISLFYLGSQVNNKEQAIKGLSSLAAAGIIAFFTVSVIYLPIAENLLFDSSELNTYISRKVPLASSWLTLLSLFSSSHFFESYNAFFKPEYIVYHNMPGMVSTYHVGTTAVFLAGFALAAKNLTKLHRFMCLGCAATMVLFLAHIFGLPGYTWLISRIPVLGMFGKAYVWSGVMVPCTILVSFGIRNIVAQRVSLLPLFTIVITVFALCFGVYYTGRINGQTALNPVQAANLTKLFIFIIITTALIALINYIKIPKFRIVLGWALVLVLFCNLFAETKFIFYNVPDFFRNQKPELEFIKENAGLQRAIGLGQTVFVQPERSGSWGVYVIGSTNMSVMPEYQKLYSDNIVLGENQGWSIFMTAENVQDKPETNVFNTFFLDITGVKYLVQPDYYVNYAKYWEERGFVEVAHSLNSAVKIFENTNVWPRAFWLPAESLPVSYGSNDKHILSPEFRNILKEVSISSYHNASVTLQGNAADDGIVVLTDNWHRNWEAELNGEKTDIIKIHETFRGVSVPVGNFEITMHYKPDTLNFATALMCLGLFINFLGLLVPYRLWIKISDKLLKRKLAKIKALLIKHQSFILYSFVGVINTAIDFLVFTVLLYINVEVAIAQAAAYMSGLVISFFLNKNVTFKKSVTNLRQIVLFIFVNIITMLISVTAIYFLHELMGLQEHIAKIFFVAPIVIFLNYTSLRYAVFTEHER